MKKIVAKLILAASCFGALAPALLATPHHGLKLDHPGSRPDRFTLLPGPNLLSPARGAPQPSGTTFGSDLTKPTPGILRFVPSAQSVPGTIAPVPRATTFKVDAPRSSSELPSFDATLPATPVTLPKSPRQNAK